MSSRADRAAPPARRAAAMAAVAIVATVTGGCGFRLAQPTVMPASMARTQIVAPDRRAALVRHLETAFRDAGVELVGTTADPAATPAALLRIVEDQTGERVLSVTPRGGPEEIELFHRVRFEVSADGRALVEPRTLLLTRNLQYDKDDILGTEEERDNLRALLAAEMASLIVRTVALVQ